MPGITVLLTISSCFSRLSFNKLPICSLTSKICDKSILPFFSDGVPTQIKVIWIFLIANEISEVISNRFLLIFFFIKSFNDGSKKELDIF